MAAIVEVEQAGLVYPTPQGGLVALRGVSFTVEPESFVCIVGPSGSGKSTLLQLLAGLQAPTSGQVLFDGKPMTRPRRRIGMVFQKANLMPWRTVLANVTLPLELQGMPPAEARREASALLELVGLQGFAGEYPRGLSGGMEQRVAIARALVARPSLLLLDEPFGSLDALTRERMSVELLRIWEARRKTAIMVTHSISEAVFLADRILVMSPRPGRIAAEITVPLGRPRTLELLADPRLAEISGRVRALLLDEHAPPARLRAAEPAAPAD
jgi:NitT/TauT family transport system ATP-binding protein